MLWPQDHMMWMPQSHHLILTASRPTPFLNHLATHLIQKLLQIIFKTVKSPPYSASIVASKATRPLFVWPCSPAILRGLSSSPGSSNTLNQQLGDTSACSSTSITLASDPSEIHGAHSCSLCGNSHHSAWNYTIN